MICDTDGLGDCDVIGLILKCDTDELGDCDVIVALIVGLTCVLNTTVFGLSVGPLPDLVLASAPGCPPSNKTISRRTLSNKLPAELISFPSIRSVCSPS